MSESPEEELWAQIDSRTSYGSNNSRELEEMLEVRSSSHSVFSVPYRAVSLVRFTTQPPSSRVGNPDMLEVQVGALLVSARGNRLQTTYEQLKSRKLKRLEVSETYHADRPYITEVLSRAEGGGDSTTSSSQ